MYDKTTFLSGMAMGLTGKGNPTFEGSGKYLYNGVELPDINSVLSQYPQYPYVLVLHSETIEYYHLLCISTNQCDTVNGFGGKWVTSNGVGIAFLLENGEWIRKYDFENRSWAHTTKVIWTSHDILNDDSSDDSGIYLAASPNPVPVEDTFTKGYLVGAELRRKRVLPEAEETATMLYNGVELPNINTVWTNKETYPYALVIQNPGKYTMLFVAHEFGSVYTDTNPSGSSYRAYPIKAPYAWYQLSTTGWSFLSTKDTDSSYKIAGYPPVWSSFDLLNEDGSVYLAASEPAPVYE